MFIFLTRAAIGAITTSIHFVLEMDDNVASTIALLRAMMKTDTFRKLYLTLNVYKLVQFALSRFWWA